MINHEIASKLDQIKEILIKNKVVKAYLFGSVLRDDFNNESDIDIIVNIDESLDISTYGNSYWNIQFGLEDMLRRKIDLVTECSIKNPYFKKEVDETKVEII